jgi:hypothetical protein
MSLKPLMTIAALLLHGGSSIGNKTAKVLRNADVAAAASSALVDEKVQKMMTEVSSNIKE